MKHKELAKGTCIFPAPPVRSARSPDMNVYAKMVLNRVPPRAVALPLGQVLSASFDMLDRSTLSSNRSEARVQLESEAE